MAVAQPQPTLRHERRLWKEGLATVVGMDEVGRGAWAGPLTVGAAVVSPGRRLPPGVRDSKTLSEASRERLFSPLAESCARWAVGHATAQECDELGMSAAQRLAGSRALESLGVDVDAVVLDGCWDFVGHPRTLTMVRADATCLSVAAASILAKVTRDRMMRSDSSQFPGYHFDSNKGYPCPRHKAALYSFGPTPIHRQSWAFMDGTPWPRLLRDRRSQPPPATL